MVVYDKVIVRDIQDRKTALEKTTVKRGADTQIHQADHETISAQQIGYHYININTEICLSCHKRFAKIISPRNVRLKERVSVSFLNCLSKIGIFCSYIF